MDNSAIKILLVDDEPDILEIVGYNLKQEGYSVFTAENGIQAIEKAKSVQPHLIILDVMLEVKIIHKSLDLMPVLMTILQNQLNQRF